MIWWFVMGPRYLREERHYQPGLQKLQQLLLLCYLEIADDVADS